MFKKYPAVQETRQFITLFATAPPPLFLSSTRRNQFTSSPYLYNSILILSFGYIFSPK